MDITLYVNNSEVNKIKKSLSGANTLTGKLRNESNVISPQILIAAENPAGYGYNYCYIPDFKRYYFIKDITSIRQGIWNLSLESDPLMSFADAILNCQVILNETTETGKSNYLPGRNWVNNCKNKTDILNFSNGLNNEGQFILITAGG